MNVVVWVPWGDLMHEESDVGGYYWRRGPGNKRWWDHRTELFKKYSLNSIVRQMVKPNMLVCGVANETPDGYHDGLAQVLRSQRVIPTHIHFHNAKETVGRGQNPPLSFLRQLAPLAPVAVLWLDSDDCYGEKAVQMVGAEYPMQGKVLAFRQGYLYDALSGRMWVYDPRSCPPPFFARVYTKEAFGAPDAMEKYEHEWEFKHFHHKLGCSRVLVDMPGGNFCVVAHDDNTSTALTSDKVQSKLTKEVEHKPELEKLKREFGL